MEHLQDIRPSGYKSLTNSLTMEVAFDDQLSDVIYYRYWSDTVDEWKEREIEFSRNGNAYFKEGNGNKQYLNEFMRY